MYILTQYWRIPMTIAEILAGRVGITYQKDVIPSQLALMAEFISVSVHAVRTFIESSGSNKKKIGVWGDGSLSYVLACVLKEYLPDSIITIIGTSSSKMKMFNFVDRVICVDEVEDGCQFDHCFECVGGPASGNAINQMIHTVLPQGTLVLLGVSEEKVAVNTRMILEKDLTLLGRSRSSREDFVEAAALMTNRESFLKRVSMLISEEVDIHEINDEIYRKIIIEIDSFKS